MKVSYKKIITSALALIVFSTAAFAKEKNPPKNAELLVRPPLLRLSENGYTLIWNDNSTDTPVITLQHGKDKQKLTPNRGKVNFKDSGFYIELTNLEPGEKYTVKIPEHKNLTFMAPPAPQDGFTFAAISDHQTIPEKTEIGFKAVKKENPNCIISAGDMLEDGKLKNWAKNFFEKIPIIEGIPFGCTQGNNDTGSGLFSSFLALDPKYYTTEYSNARFIFLDSNSSFNPTGEQIQWFEQVLKENKSLWTIVVYHHSSFLSTNPDHSHTRYREVLTELYEKYGVDLVINGHNHLYDRTAPINGTVYVTLPTMSSHTPKYDVKHDSPYYAKTVPGFLGYGMFNVSSNKIKGTIKDLNGKIIDTFEILK